jgi:hypothetical protein
MSGPPGVSPTPSATAPAGSREDGLGLDPALLRRRVSQIVSRGTEAGRPIRRADAMMIVLGYTGPADGWDTWLQHRFDPTAAAVLYNADQAGAV